MGFNYIIFQLGDDSDPNAIVRRLPVIYPDLLVHSDVASAMQKVRGMEKAIPVSAGNMQLSC